MAFLLDGVVPALVLFLVGVGVGYGAANRGAGLALVAGLGVVLVAATAAALTRSTSPGKALLGMVVRDTRSGAPAPSSRVLLREALRSAPLWIVAVSVAASVVEPGSSKGWLTFALWIPALLTVVGGAVVAGGRAWWDAAAGTCVISVRGNDDADGTGPQQPGR